MCWVAAAAQAGLSIMGTIAGANAQNKALQQQATAAVSNMNYNFQNYEMQRQDAFDEAVTEIEKTRLNAMQLNSSVEAAVNEDLSGGGRTAQLIMRSVQGDEARNVGAVKENYRQKSNEIDLNKESIAKGTQMNLDALKDAAKTNAKAARLGIVSSIIGGVTSGMSAKNDAISKGYDWDFFQGTVRKKSNVAQALGMGDLKAKDQY